MISLRERVQTEFQQKLQHEMSEQGIDGLILTDYGAIYYATGYASQFQRISPIPGFTLAVVLAKGECGLVLSEFEMQSPKAQCKDIFIETITSGIFIDEIECLVKDKPTRPDGNAGFSRAMDIIKSAGSRAKIGVQYEYLTVNAWEYLMSNVGEATLIDCGPLLDKVRAVKTKWEIDVMREGALLSDVAIKETMAEFHVGMTQAEYLNAFAIKCFQKSVYVMEAINMNAFGNHFSPVAIPCDFPAKEGDLIRFDGGATFLSYLTDFARTYCIGKASPRKKEIYAAITAGYEKAMSLIKPGVAMSDVFDQAQEAVRQSGIPNYLRGFVGHSIGCNKFAEEYPYVSPSSTALFEPGMVLSIELPYYNPNLGGFNIEDTIVITENGYEKFTDCPRHIIEI